MSGHRMPARENESIQKATAASVRKCGKKKTRTKKEDVYDSRKDDPGVMNGTVCAKDLIEYDWWQISGHPGLSEEFIRTYADRVEWLQISALQKLSEGFIHEYADKLDWEQISEHQKLSEKFICEHADQIDRETVSVYQPLSEDFIEKHAKQVDWLNISRYQRLSSTFMQAHNDQLCMGQIQNSWAYKTSEELEQAVRDTGLYECHEGYFTAYKGIRADWYSYDTFQYRYMPGETYETFADCSSDRYSFGFSASTMEAAKKYCKERVIPCRIEYQDVARVVHSDGSKIRCRKLTVLA